MPNYDSAFQISESILVLYMAIRGAITFAAFGTVDTSSVTQMYARLEEICFSHKRCHIGRIIKKIEKCIVWKSYFVYVFTTIWNAFTVLLCCCVAEFLSNCLYASSSSKVPLLNRWGHLMDGSFWVNCSIYEQNFHANWNLESCANPTG